MNIKTDRIAFYYNVCITPDVPANFFAFRFAPPPPRKDVNIIIGVRTTGTALIRSVVFTRFTSEVRKNKNQ
ncbi:hypothetical protein JTB14_010438 [Gonioctena quinquepunctata]|nr:hypothetical protein JTB14_010438 [Gonioctena quinquepunctata]